MIKKVGDEFCVFSKDGKKLGCHPTEKEAQAQLAAIEASKHAVKSWVERRYMNHETAKGIWDKVSGNDHPHAACVEMMSGKVDDPHAFCTAAEMAAVGTTPAERAAKKNAQSYAQKLEGVEIFATGKHNGDDYNDEDLQDMVEAFGKLDYQPAVTLGHVKDPGAPAVGYISALRRDGKKLIADLVDVHDKVYEAIKNRLFNRVSAEIYWNLERGGKKYRRALKALALLGADVPGVAGLKPLSELFAGNAGDVHTTEGEFSTEAAGGSPNSKGAAKMDEKDLQELHDRLAAAERAKVEEAAKREVAEKALAEAKKAASGGDTDLATAIAKLTSDEKATRITELALKVREAEEDAKKEKQAREVAEKQLSENSDRIRKLEETGRRERIEKMAETCRIPALRQFVRSFADLATRAAEVKVYDANGAEKSALTEVEAFIAYVNGHAARIFTVVSTEDSSRKSAEKPGDEVDRRAKIHMERNKGVSYNQAVHAVLEEDEQLKADYAA
jgi:hypothetical protein